MRPLKICFAAVALAGFAGLIPFENEDISHLNPVEILCISRTESGVRIAADGGIAARGNDLREALTRLSEAAPGSLILQSVDQIVFTDCVPDAETLTDCGLRPAVRLYASPVPVENPDALATYLSRHRRGTPLGAWNEKAALPMLRVGESGLYLEEELP